MKRSTKYLTRGSDALLQLEEEQVLCAYNESAGGEELINTDVRDFKTVNSSAALLIEAARRELVTAEDIRSIGTAIIKDLNPGSLQ